jgi:hypothetical protein
MLISCSRVASQSEQPPYPHWRRITNSEAGYVVEFPSRPAENPAVLSNQQGVVSYRQFVSSLGDKQAFLVATLVTSLTNDFSNEEVKFLLRKATHGAAGRGDRLVAERGVALGTNLGLEAEIMKANGTFVKMRFYQVGHDLQELTVLVPAANRQSTNINYFLDSFSLISK